MNAESNCEKLMCRQFVVVFIKVKWYYIICSSNGKWDHSRYFLDGYVLLSFRKTQLLRTTGEKGLPKKNNTCASHTPGILCSGIQPAAVRRWVQYLLPGRWPPAQPDTSRHMVHAANTKCM
jgi:hypothetical protein